MKVSFEIEYRTEWGESLEVCWVRTAADGAREERTASLATTDGVMWRTEVTLDETGGTVEYRYRVVAEGSVKREEWALTPHRIAISEGSHRVACTDRWREMPDDAFRYTSAFTEAFARHDMTPPQPSPAGEGGEKAPSPLSCRQTGTETSGQKHLTLHVFAPDVPEGQTLAVLGNQPALGEWQAGQEVRLACQGLNEWTFSLDLSAVTDTLEYKFLTLDCETGEQRLWEMRDNRLLVPPCIGQGMTQHLQLTDAHFPVAPWRGAGCVLPVFSIRTEQTFGVGDFGALRKMVDWVAETGQRVLQILPINDTTMTGRWTDSYPYNSISIYALHPMYVDLSALPPLKDEAQAAHYEQLRLRLNALTQVDYEGVNEAKRGYLRLLFKQEWARTVGRKAYKDFYRQNEEWLVPYAAYSCLRDRYATPDFRRWLVLSEYDPGQVAALMKKGSKSAGEMNFYCYVQFLLHEQLLEASRYARSRGVVIKGDIPIGISRTSVEAWVEPHLFHMDGQAGAPPDAFSANGQNWGFPTYNWERMQADGCQWWLRRFRKMAEYFDAYRIDHVLGFFRIWEIPQHSVHGLLGQFSPALPMSVEEIESYGLPWRGDDYTRPYIDDWTLNELFGDQTAEVRHRYIESQGGGRYYVKEDYNTQRKVEAIFNAENRYPNAPDSGAKMTERVRDGLYALLSNVLFLEDHRQRGLYHPRIGAMQDYTFRQLTPAERQAFCRLHEDFYFRRHNHFWYQEAMKKLPRLTEATRMLVCAEDLGMVPACVPWVMERLGILSLEIQSMPKTYGYSFGHLWENPYRSVATISTHDMPTLRGWWDEDRERAQRFYNDALCHDGTAPHPLPSDVAEEVVRRHLESPSMLCLLSLQDWLSIDPLRRHPDPASERINIPANPRQYWRYRMHLSVEQLLSATDFNDRLHGMIVQYGR